jgi:hypothetical protein
MANPSATYRNVLISGGDSLRIPEERSGFKATSTQSAASLQTYGELDLGTVSASPLTLNAQQAGASLITVNPTVALNIILPVCQPGQPTIIQNTNSSNAIQVSVSGNTANSATVGTSSVAVVVQTGTNSGVVLVSGT